MAQDSLYLNKNTDFEFQIFEEPNKKLPWIAFGLYVENNEFTKYVTKFPKDGFYLTDLDSNTYYNGEFESSKDYYDKINIYSRIFLSYKPQINSLVIGDRADFSITFPGIPNNNPNIRICFVFQGENRALINYNP